MTATEAEAEQPPPRSWLRVVHLLVGVAGVLIHGLERFATMLRDARNETG